MDKADLEQLWSERLRSSTSTPEEFECLAHSVVGLFSSDLNFRQHLRNRAERVTESKGQRFDPEAFDVAMARAFIADEIGFGGWDELIDSVKQPEGYPLLFRYAIAAMRRGDFSGLEATVGGPESFYYYVVNWYEQGLFRRKQETLDEILSAACMLGNTKTAAFLLDKGVDPYAGMRSWLAGPHYAVSSGRLETVKMLLKQGIPLEVENRYGGTVLGQALWSAINEHTDSHAEIIEMLLDAGAVIEVGTLEWWQNEPVPSIQTKQRVLEALRRHGAQ